jgi:branched-chain amino acid transport system substrate-binding protein
MARGDADGGLAGIDRRTFIKGAGAAGIAGLAGCTGGGGGGGGGSGDSSGGSSGGSSGDDSEDSGSDGTSTGSSGGMSTIVLGGSMSLSGDNADLGKLYRDAYQVTIDAINEAGGVEAGDGNTYELEMVLRDDETDASKSKTIYQELIDREGVDYLLGPYSSTVTLPASAVAAANQKPMVEGGGASPQIFSQGNEWIFGLLPTADKYPLSGIDLAASQGAESLALLSEDDTFSQSTREGALAKADSAGLEVVVDATFPTETSDLSTNLGKVRDAAPDMLLLAAHQKHAIILADQMESQNVSPDMAMATVGSLNDAFKEQSGENGDYVYGPSSWAINANFEDSVFGQTSDFVDAISSEFDYQPDYHSAAATGVIQTFQRAFQQVDTLEPTAVRNAIRDTQFTCAYGGIQFADNGVINKDMLVYQWQPEKGKQIVYPENVAQSDPIYPMPAWDDR